MKKTIHIIKHKLTGAKIPVEIKKMSEDNIIEEYFEVIKGRKGFTLAMLKNRWDRTQEEVLEILKQFQVPAHVNHEDVKKLDSEQTPADIAILFEEYIYGIEYITKMPHKKIKAREINTPTEH